MKGGFLNSKQYRKDIEEVLRLSLPWESLNGKNILVTGATGLICSFLVDVLMLNPIKNYQLYVVGRNEQIAHQRFFSFWEDSSFHFIRQDLQEELKWDLEFHYIIHGAGNAFPKMFSMDPIGTLYGTIEGTRNLLEYASKHQTERFIYISSAEVYGSGEQSIWHEDDCGYVDSMLPRSCYPIAKRTSENLCIAYSFQRHLCISVVRPSHIYGPTFTKTDNRVYAQFLRNVIADEDIVMKSDGSQQRAYCYVSDCVSAMLYVLFYGQNAEAYNITNEYCFISIKELAELMAKAYNKNVIYSMPGREEQQGYSILRYTRLCNKKIKSLGWNAKVGMEDGIKRTIKILLEGSYGI